MPTGKDLTTTSTTTVAATSSTSLGTESKPTAASAASAARATSAAEVDDKWAIVDKSTDGVASVTGETLISKSPESKTKYTGYYHKLVTDEMKRKIKSTAPDTVHEKKLTRHPGTITSKYLKNLTKEFIAAQIINLDNNFTGENLQELAISLPQIDKHLFRDAIKIIEELELQPRTKAVIYTFCTEPTKKGLVDKYSSQLSADDLMMLLEFTNTLIIPKNISLLNQFLKLLERDTPPPEWDRAVRFIKNECTIAKQKLKDSIPLDRTYIELTSLGINLKSHEVIATDASIALRIESDPFYPMLSALKNGYLVIPSNPIYKAQFALHLDSKLLETAPEGLLLAKNQLFSTSNKFHIFNLGKKYPDFLNPDAQTPTEIVYLQNDYFNTVAKRTIEIETRELAAASARSAAAASTAAVSAATAEAAAASTATSTSITRTSTPSLAAAGGAGAGAPGPSSSPPGNVAYTIAETPLTSTAITRATAEESAPTTEVTADVRKTLAAAAKDTAKVTKGDSTPSR